MIAVGDFRLPLLVTSRQVVLNEDDEEPVRTGNIRLFRATLCSVLNNLSDFRWPPKYLRSRERHEHRVEIVGSNRGWSREFIARSENTQI